MTDKPHEPTGPTAATLKRLFAHSGNQCAFPKCTNEVVRGNTTISEVCHIAGVRPNSARYDPGMTAKERHAYDNLILLCAIHHTVVDDDEESYTVERLVRMRTDHEKSVSPMADGQVDRAVRDHVKWSVLTRDQSGGIAAHTVHAGSINIGTATASEIRAEQMSAVRKLWGVIGSIKVQFDGLFALHMLLTPTEIQRHFDWTDDAHPKIEHDLSEYRSADAIFKKLEKAGANDLHDVRLFVNDRLWSLFFAYRGILGRVGVLTVKEQADWRSDKIIEAHCRNIGVETVLQRCQAQPLSGLERLCEHIENEFRSEANLADQRGTVH